MQPAERIKLSCRETTLPKNATLLAVSLSALLGVVCGGDRLSSTL